MDLRHVLTIALELHLLTADYLSCALHLLPVLGCDYMMIFLTRTLQIRLPLQAPPHRRFRCWKVLSVAAIRR